MTVWFITEKGERVRFIDKFQPRIYISGSIADLSKFTDKLQKSRSVVKWAYADKYADFMDDQKSKVLEITLHDCYERLDFARKVLRLGGYERFRLYNVDVPDAQLYLFEKDLFPLAFVGVTVQGKRLAYWLLDSVESVDYTLPPLRLLKLNVEIAKKKLIPSFNDEINNKEFSRTIEK